MLLASTGLLFAFLVAFSMPIVFALGTAAILGLVLGGYSLEMLASSLIGASQNWILLAIPSFIFAGTVMERCGMSNALVDLARALVGWLRGGRGHRRLPLCAGRDPGAPPGVAKGYPAEPLVSAALVTRGGGTAGHSARHPRRLLSRRLHRHRGGRDRRALFADRRPPLLPQPQLDGDPAHRLRQRDLDRGCRVPARRRDDLPIPDGRHRGAIAARRALEAAGIGAMAVSGG